MKNIIILILLTSNIVLAQNANVRVNLNILPPYSTKLTDYAPSSGNVGKMIVTLSNLVNIEQKIYLRADIKGESNGVRIYTHPDFAPTAAITLAPNQTRTLFAQEIMDLYDPNHLIYIGTNQRQIKNSDRVPEGLYSICVRAYDATPGKTSTPLSATSPAGCTSIYMKNLEAPILTQPLQKAILQQTSFQNIVFSWMIPSNTGGQTLKYKLKIVEIIDDFRNANDSYLSSTNPPFFEEEIHNSIFVYGPAQPALVPGRRYAWAVTAIDPMGNLSFQNDGRSEIREFTYGTKPSLRNNDELAQKPNQENGPNITPILMTAKSGQAVLNCPCKENLPTNALPINTLNIGDQIKVNSFVMNIVSVEKSENGTFTGTGTIPLLWTAPAKLKVKFHNISVSQTGNTKFMSAGIVKGISQKQFSYLPQADDPNLNPANLSSRDVKNIDLFLKNNSQQFSESLKNTASSIGFELPFGIQQGAYTFGITEVFFDPYQTTFGAVSAIDIPDGNTSAAFKISNACISASDLCGDFKLSLVEDLNINALNMKIIKDDANNGGTFLEFKKQGTSDLNLCIDYTFSGTLKNLQTHQNLTARLKAKTNLGWANWIAEVQIPDFYIEGIKDVNFSTENNPIFYDHSDKSNPSNIPTSISIQSGNETLVHSGMESPTWHGFYIPKLKVSLPAIIKKVGQTNSKIGFETQHLIIDSQGLTANIKSTTPIITLQDGSLDGWYASIESVHLNLFKSGFKTSMMKGKIALPGTGNPSDTKNQLEYSSILSYSTEQSIQFAFNIKPKNDLQFTALFSTLTLRDNSVIKIEANPTGFMAKTELHGSISIVSNNNSIPGIGALKLPGIEFENMKWMTQAPFWDKEGFLIKLASEQKTLAGLNFNLETPELALTPSNDGFFVGLRFKGKLALLDEVFNCKADAAFLLGSNIKKNNDRISWLNAYGKIEDINLNAGTSIGPLTVNGILKYYNKNQDEGFIGKLNTSVADLFSLDFRAQFGTINQSSERYKYFSFNALLDLKTGITLFPPILSLYGFGGGVYYNMNVAAPVTNIPPTAKNNQDYSSVEALLNDPTQPNLVPKKGYFGLNATVLVGFTSRNTLDANATMGMTFNTKTGGVANVYLDADVRILTDINKPLAQRNDASTGRGSMFMEYNFEEKTFSTSFDLKVNVPKSGDLLSASGKIVFLKDPNQWYLYAGRPFENQKMNVKLFNLLQGGSYFQIGSVIDPMPAIPEKVYEFMGLVQNATHQDLETQKNKMSGYKQQARNPNAGMITGADIRLETGRKKFLVFYGEFDFLSGFDMGISTAINCLNTPASGGPGGWYAKGNAYLGAQADVGIEVDMFLIKGAFRIFKAGAGSTMRVGLPQPFFLEGYMGSNFDILDGLIKGNFNFKLSIGEECKTETDVLGGLEIISEIYPQSESGKKVSIIDNPSLVFNINVGKNFVFEDFINGDKNGPKIRKFLFDLECMDLKLNQQSISSKAIKPVSPNNVRHFYIDLNEASGNANPYLEKNKDYTFSATVYMKEMANNSYGFVATNGNIISLNSDKNRRAKQQKNTKFQTDDGLSFIPENLYSNTSPLNGHTAIPYQYNDLMFIDFSEKVAPLQLIKGGSENTKFVLKVYKDNSKVGGDLSVSFQQNNDNTTRALFPKINLEPNSKYTFLVVAVQPAQGANSTTTTQKEITQTFSSSIEPGSYTSSIKLLKTGAKTPYQALLNNEMPIAGFTFKTSRYATYEQKVKALQIETIQLDPAFVDNLQLSSTNKKLATSPISLTNTLAQNKKILDSWGLNDKAGNYIIRRGLQSNFIINSGLFGELFNQADLYNYTSEDVFGSNLKNSKKLNKLFPNAEKELKNQDYIELSIDKIASLTGVSRSKFSYAKDAISGLNGNGFKTANMDEYVWIKTDKLSQSAIPKNAPENNSTLIKINASASQNNLSQFIYQLVSKPMSAEFRARSTQQQSNDMAHVIVNVSNPIQAHIEQLIQPNPNQYKGANSVLNQNNFWQKISILSNQLQSGQVELQQLDKNLNSILR